MKRTSTKHIVYAALFAALYVVLTYTQNFLLPGTTSNAIQFRISEALCVFAFFTPAAVAGLTVGCLIFNLSNAGALPLDWLVGTVATLLTTFTMYRFRKIRIGKWPLLGFFMPAVWNSLIVGAELTVYFGGGIPLWLNMIYVAAGELAVILVVGIPLYFAFSSRHLQSRLFETDHRE